ncbi:retrovirus-related Pol polyprotein from transposon 17.6 [Ixodes scapularis]
MHCSRRDPRVFVPVGVDETFCGDVLLEGSLQWLLGRGIGIARGVAELQDGHTVALVTNFRQEAQHLTKGTAVGHAEELPDSAAIAGTSENLSSWPPKTTPPLKFNIDPTLPTPQRRQLGDLLAEFNECFSTSSKVRQTTVAKHRIVTEDNALPVHRSPYRVLVKRKEVIQKQVQEMLDDDIVQPSSSPWASPVVLVKKKDRTLRFCVDYRRLNALTKKDVYPLPRIDDTLDRLRHARYFSSMDLKTGYWQIEVDERDREKTAFVTPDGLYEFKVMPFGLSTAPAMFQRVMDTVLSGLKWQSCLVYLDDAAVFASDFDEHLRRLSSRATGNPECRTEAVKMSVRLRRPDETPPHEEKRSRRRLEDQTSASHLATPWPPGRPRTAKRPSTSCTGLRWRNQPRPNPSQLPAQIPQPFLPYKNGLGTSIENPMGSARPPSSGGSRPQPSYGKPESCPDQLLVGGVVAEDRALGPFPEHTPVPPVPAPRSTTAAPSASTTTSDAAMNELEEYLANNPATPDATDGPDFFVDGAAAEDPTLGLFPEHVPVPPRPPVRRLRHYPRPPPPVTRRWATWMSS